MSHASARQIEDLLRTKLSPTALQVQDDSADHAGHTGAAEGSHFSVSIVAPGFAGLNRVARHRLVYDALGDLMRQGVHALAIDAKAPSEA